MGPIKQPTWIKIQHCPSEAAVMVKHSGNVYAKISKCCVHMVVVDELEWVNANYSDTEGPQTTSAAAAVTNAARMGAPVPSHKPRSAYTDSYVCRMPRRSLREFLLDSNKPYQDKISRDLYCNYRPRR
jgi:hypothetical protein